MKLNSSKMLVDLREATGCNELADEEIRDAKNNVNQLEAEFAEAETSDELYGDSAYLRERNHCHGYRR